MSLATGPSQENPPIRHRSTRDRPAKPPLSEDAVVDAALAVLLSEGLEAVTMRRVAEALDTGAASLYVYVAGRDGLLQAMLNRVTDTIELEVPDPAHWRAQLHALLQRIYNALVAHPGIATLTLGDPPTTEPVLLVAENLLGILLAGGVVPQDAAWACDLFVLLVTGVAIEEDARRARNGGLDPHKQVDELYKTFVALPFGQFPLLVTHASQMVAGDGDERFRFTIDVVIDGVLARAAQQ